MMNNEQIKSNLQSSKHWLRLIFMLLFAAVLQIASIVMWVLVVLQFLFSLITGSDNVNLRKFGYSLSVYIFHIFKFLTYSSEEKPFPFADWPQAGQPRAGQPQAGQPRAGQPQAGQPVSDEAEVKVEPADSVK